MFVRVFAEEISIRMGELSKGDGHHPIIEGPNRTKKWKTVEFPLCLTGWTRTLIFSCALCPWFSGLQTWTGIISSLVLRPANYATSFPGSPACRWQIMGLLSLYNCMSQYIIIESLSRSIYLSIHPSSLLVLFLWRTLTNIVCIFWILSTLMWK